MNGLNEFSISVQFTVKAVSEQDARNLAEKQFDNWFLKGIGRLVPDFGFPRGTLLSWQFCGIGCAPHVPLSSTLLEQTDHGGAHPSSNFSEALESK